MGRGAVLPKYERVTFHKEAIQQPGKATAEFIEKYDCPAFDPNYDTAPLEFFEPMVMRLFEFLKNSIYKKEKVAEAA